MKGLSEVTHHIGGVQVQSDGAGADQAGGNGENGFDCHGAKTTGLCLNRS